MKKHVRIKPKAKDLDYANEGRDEEFDGFRSVLIALTSGGVGLLFALLTASSAFDKIRLHSTCYCCALLSFVVALCLLLLSYCFGCSYFNVHYDLLKSPKDRNLIVRDAIYAFLDNWCVYLSGGFFVLGIVGAGIFVYRLVF